MKNLLGNLLKQKYNAGEFNSQGLLTTVVIKQYLQHIYDHPLFHLNYESYKIISLGYLLILQEGQWFSFSLYFNFIFRLSYLLQIVTFLLEKLNILDIFMWNSDMKHHKRYDECC
ncbi:CLUMA_CG010571, isoform A [Clunio marinus]|uniref:CLUMA_CG010571, isoform A n=1 Tax=Clunio marinus TaxID=568069 RepID=A0A1J1IDU8_9DIPT|nr:CLUMA_CG010571, isoform A [Clunio marinus]